MGLVFVKKTSMNDYTSNDKDFVILSDGDSSNIMLSLQILGEVRSHKLPSDVRRSSKMSLSLLSSGAGHFYL